MENILELFALGPARPPGPCNFSLAYKPHTDNEQETVARIRELLVTTVRRFVAEIFARAKPCEPGKLCSFLSGGLDSSLVTAIAAAEYRKRGEQLTTLEFDFADSCKHFAGSSFQPDLDRHWAAKMAKECRTNHVYIECTAKDLADSLLPAVDARGFPGMADVDASLLFFCANRPSGIEYALTGECADEIFGGYPWFDPDFLGGATEVDKRFFPWSNNIDTRTRLLKEEYARQIPEIIAAHTSATLRELDEPFRDNLLARRGYLTLRWFMPTLTDRMYYMGKYSGLTGLLPFAEPELLEYVWNIPWSMKRKNNIVKYLLKEAAKGILPPDIIHRKKSPFPKTYDPAYTALVAARLREVIERGGRLFEFIEREKLAEYITETETAPHKTIPWFGQLMQAPQMLAYLLQVDYYATD